MKLRNIGFVFLVLWAVFGMIMMGNIVHEYSHRNDFEGLAKEDYVCALVMPSNFSWEAIWNAPLAYYSWHYANNSKELQLEADKIDTYTEWKAYSLDGIIGFIFMCFFMVVFYHWYEYNKLKTEIDNIYKSQENNYTYDGRP